MLKVEKKHKYIAKVKINPDYTRYFYDKQEYTEFLSAKQENTLTGIPSIKLPDVSTIVQNGKSIAAELVSKTIDSIEQKVLDVGKNFFDSLIGQKESIEEIPKESQEQIEELSKEEQKNKR